MISSTLASQPPDEIISTNLEAKPSNESPLGSNSSNHDNTAIFKFGNNSSVLAAVAQFPSADCVVASTSLSNSAVGSTAASSLPPDSSRNQSSFAAKTLSDASNNLKFISSKSNKLDLLYPDNSVNSLPSVTGFGGIRATQTESPTSKNSASVNLFKSTSGNGANSSFDTATPRVPSFGNSSATASNPFPSASGSHSTFSPTFLGASNNKFSFSSTKVDNIASSDLYNGCKISSSAIAPGFAETLPTQAQNGSSDVLASQVQLTSGQRASGCSVSAAPCISSFAITSASPASSLFLHAGGSQPAVAPTTLSGASNNLFSFSSKPKDTGLSVLDKSAKTFPGVSDTEFGGIPRTQVLSGTSLISSSWPNQSQSSCSSTIGMNISSSSGLGSSPFVTTHTNSKLLNPTSSFPMGSGLSSPSTDAAATATATATTTSPLATSSNVFGLNSQPPTLPASSLFAASASSESSGFAFATPFIFNSTSNLASSFSPAASTSVSSRHPTFGLQNSAVGVSTSGDNEMSIEESMNGDNNQSAGNMFQQFGQPGSAAAPAFSAPAAQSASPFFQFASKQNPTLPSSAPPQFQPSGSMELPQGGSFAMGSGGGGGDKSSRRIIKVRKDKMRKR
ncbi:nuclear pore complex protein NUP1-like [Zingiber officinale]|uniref:nuclear pore complex protein NUP1-like n=1 Tax=Zingiber officinale TaxID=94328 RepID=UPI001C4C5AB5|nr:nuclear pore complex protein NUP1-like [Zingiber officinale]